VPEPHLADAKRTVKYYVYLSRRKVDMLYEQIPRSPLKRITGSLSIELPMLKVAIGKTEPELGYGPKLAIVLAYIEQEFGIGTVDDPSAYFGGELPLYWGLYRERADDDSGLVFFGGRTDRTILGLGGSIDHVIGAKPSGVMHSRSNTPWLIEALLKDAGRRGRFHKPRTAREKHDDREMALQAVEVAVSRMMSLQKPADLMEFVAAKLIEGPVTKWWREVGPQLYKAKNEKRNQTKVLVGSPLYVALVQ
jgi:hypothetical protein